MARVTVEDCIEQIPNRFELVLLAGQRAREIGSGAPLTVDRDNDKDPVIALREIAAKSVVLDQLRNNLVQGLQHHHEKDEPEAEGTGFGADKDANLLDEMIREQQASVAAKQEEALMERMFEDDPNATMEDE